METTPTHRSSIQRVIKLLLLPAAVLAIAPLAAPAAEVYIGDNAAAGTAITNGNGQDTAPTVTYAFVNTNGPSASYTALANTTIKLTEVNFFKSTSTGTLRPYVARYTGDLSNNSVNTGTNYTVLAIGDAFSFATDAVSSVRNLSFTVDGVNPELTLNAGDVLVAGYLNSVSAGVVRMNTAATGNAIDYTALVNTLPSTVPNPLTASASLTLNRTLQYNVGFNVVPEPSMLGGLGLVGLALVSRRQRRGA
ncbi:MAG TPA: PEP-CTERM sorting domain-containing protein [Tepidisphaeraceae bacterium]|jgi:hypothetical protein